MPDDSQMTHSLAYRKNEAAILAGKVPEKYTRLLPYIDGSRIVEAGSAEGVLACLLVREGKSVTAIEANEGRHQAAKRLALTWGIASPEFVNGRIENSLHHLAGADTFVAVRAIYYWGEHLDTVFAEVAKHCLNVVLCGNKNRAAWWRQGIPNRNDKADNYYASAEGMRALLERHGYAIVQEETEGDPIVVGRKDD